MGKDGLTRSSSAIRRGGLVFGVGSLHHLPFQTQRVRLLRQALETGFRSFDVAPAYGNGLNELELGLALHSYGADCQVTTKFGIPVDLYGARHPHLFFLLRGIRRLLDSRYSEEYKRRMLSPGEMTGSLEGSLRRLKRDYVDNFMIHEPLGILTTAQIADLHKTASRLKEAGKLLRWGVCGPATSIGQLVHDPEFDVFQFPLDDIEKVGPQPSRRRIGYGVHRFYLTSSCSRNISFPEFVSDRLKNLSIDLIVATTSRIHLNPFR